MKAQHKSEIHYRGISRALADTSVKDGGVAESVNVIVDNDELGPIVPPKVHPDFPTGVDYDLLYIHSTSNYKNYIGIHDDKLCQVLPSGVNCFFNLNPGESVLSIKGIGNTLVVATDQKMFYVLYKDQAYKYLGEQVPFPNIHVVESLPEGNEKQVKIHLGNLVFAGDTLIEWVIDNSGGGSDAIYYGEDREFPVDPLTGKSLHPTAVDLSEKLWAGIEKAMKQLRADSMFPHTLMARYAVRLYDGTYTRHSVPMMLGFINKFIDAPHHERTTGTGAVDDCHLVCNIRNAYKIILSTSGVYDSLEAWADVIKGIDFFISEPIHKDYKYNGNILGISNGVYSLEEEPRLEEMVVNTALFYRTEAFNLEEFEGVTTLTLDKIGELTKDSDNLRTQPALLDDYLSHHKISASSLFEFNSRLNIANVKTEYYIGPPRFASEDTADMGEWLVRYYIKDNSGSLAYVTVKYKNETAPGPWIVYPDPRCNKIDISHGGSTKSLVMKEHPLLHCAYYFAGFNKPVNEMYKEGAAAGTIGEHSINTYRSWNQIMQSEINNPFFFPLSGRHTIPAGKILGVASSTKALSQGQFGQFPLYIFCSDGLWALETQADGTYVRIAPMSRDVCINPESVTGIDGAVIFVTKRGVMLVDGAEVRCISDIMNGLHFRADSLEGVSEAGATFWGSLLPRHASDDLSFIDYVSKCFIAYDYPNQRLIFVNKDRPYQYIYSVISGTWHKLFAEKGLYISRTLNSYPDCYLQARSAAGSTVYNFSDIDDVNDSKTRTLGLVISRPLDLDMPGVLKTIMQIKHRGYFEEGAVGMVLLGSRDGRNYARVRSLKSTSYKYYRIALYLNLLPTERISWSEVTFNTKFTNKLR